MLCGIACNLCILLQVESFYVLLKESAFYGAVKDTVCSLLLNVLPRPGFKYKETMQSDLVDDAATKHLSKAAQLVHMLQKFLYEMGGFCHMEVGYAYM